MFHKCILYVLEIRSFHFTNHNYFAAKSQIEKISQICVRMICVGMRKRRHSKIHLSSPLVDRMRKRRTWQQANNHLSLLAPTASSPIHHRFCSWCQCVTALMDLHVDAPSLPMEEGVYMGECITIMRMRCHCCWRVATRGPMALLVPAWDSAIFVEWW